MPRAIASEASTPRFSKIEPHHHAALIAEVSRILREEESHKARIFDEAFWRWQYEQLPSGVANVYAVFVGDEIKGYYHVPLYAGRVRGEAETFAVVQDVAVSKDLRGQGVFRRLAEFVNADLERAGVRLIYTFPNDKSIHTFVKYNAYTHVSTFIPYVLPLRSGGILRTKLSMGGVERVVGFCADRALGLFAPAAGSRPDVRLHPRIDEPITTLFARHQASHVIALDRSADYLRWRYDRRPSSRHLIYSATEGNELVAAAIFKQDMMFDNPALLLTDFAHAPGREESLLRLLREVRRHKDEPELREFNLVFAAGNSPVFARLPRLGFIPIPARFNPRPLNLLTRGITGANAAPLFRPENWHVTLGDWDVF